MAEELKEVTRLLEAIKSFEAIEDPAERAAAVTKALETWPDLHKELRRIREESVQTLRNDRRMTWSQIGKILGGVTAERAQQISKGLSGAQRKKNQRQAAAATAAEQSKEP
ncbi:hypothetical protein [Streptomyces sp. NPDC004763]